MPADQFRFKLDTTRDHVYSEGRVKNRADHSEERAGLHLKAARYYAERARPDLDAWHRIGAADYAHAMRLIASISAEMEAAFRFGDLRALRRGLERGLAAREDEEGRYLRA